MAAELVNTGKKAEFLAKVKESDNVEDVEIEYFDVTSQEVAAEVFNSWRLEPLMVQSISGSHEPSNADDEVKPYANALKAMRLAVNVKEQFSDSSIQKALSFVKELGMDENLIQTAVKKVTGQ